jgi:hypothetical protein
MKQLNWYQIFGVQIPDGRTVLPTDDIQIWLHCANIWDKNYTTLAEVLADSTTLSALISSNNAVDYLVRSTTWAGVQVPVMTSDNTPSGECFGSSYYNDSRYRYYRSFDGTISSTEGWNSSENSQTEYIGYDFTRDVVVTKVELACRNSSYPQRNVTLRGSHDKVTWDDISVLSSNITDTNTHTYTVSNSTAYRYYSIQSTAGNGNVVTFSYIQFYTDSLCDNSTAMTYIGLNNYCANKLLADATWCSAICQSTYKSSVTNVMIPIMTSDNTPEGETIHSTMNASHPAWKAFDGDDSSWGGVVGNSAWSIGYKFTSKKKIYAFEFNPVMPDAANCYGHTFTFKVSNDGSTWETIASYTYATGQKVPLTLVTINDKYQYYKFDFAGANGVNPGPYYYGFAYTIRLYGREDV